MTKLFCKNSATLISLIIAVSLWLTTFIIDLDIFEKLHAFLEEVEHIEADELVIPLFILLIGIGIDFFRKNQEKKKLILVTQTKLEFLQTIVRTVQDIVGNSMNNLVLYNLEAKTTGKLSEESIEKIDELIEETTRQINSLAAVDKVQERKLGQEIEVIDISINKKGS